MKSLSFKLFLLALFPLSLYAMINPVAITLMPQMHPAYVDIHLDSANSTAPVSLNFALQGSDSAVSVTSANDPNFPTTCSNILNPASTCEIWLHSTNNQSLGMVNEGELNIAVSYLGVAIESASFNLGNETDLYVAGDFDQAFDPDGTVINAYHMVKWSGAHWLSLTDTANSLSNNVFALAVASDGMLCGWLLYFWWQSATFSCCELEWQCLVKFW